MGENGWSNGYSCFFRGKKKKKKGLKGGSEWRGTKYKKKNFLRGTIL
jgi:hypothetical protein